MPLGEIVREHFGLLESDSPERCGGGSGAERSSV